MTRTTPHIAIKKKYGQHFLRDHHIVHSITKAVTLLPTSSVFEVGCGDGFLTREILEHSCARLWVFEIDDEWATHIRTSIKDPRLQVYTTDILSVDFSIFKPHAPWILLANLPYQITFPFLYLLQKNRHMLQEGVIMIQEEVAQKLTRTKGRGYGFHSLFFQHYFELKMLAKVPPTAFYPPPKIYSRLVHLRPKKQPVPIPNEDEFWRFIKMIFHQPRRTLKNNLAQTHIDVSGIPVETLHVRAQQLSMDELIALWNMINQVL